MGKNIELENVDEVLFAFKTEHPVVVTIKTILTDGKSGAYVACVDCTGNLHDGSEIDGQFILKIDSKNDRKLSEAEAYAAAEKNEHFSGIIPKVQVSFSHNDYILMLVSTAGNSLLKSRPLQDNIAYFAESYALLNCHLRNHYVHYDKLTTFTEELNHILKECLNSNRLQNNLNIFFPSIKSASLWIYGDESLPNPLHFLGITSDIKFVPFRGPVHGDCHQGNIFIKSKPDGTPTNLYLIDLAFYQEQGPMFFDQAYLELNLLLNAHNESGNLGWQELVKMLIEYDPECDPHRIGSNWVASVAKGRKPLIDRLLTKYPNRTDDIYSQFYASFVAAGLFVLNRKLMTQSSHDIHLKALLWSSLFLRKYLMHTNNWPFKSEDQAAVYRESIEFDDYDNLWESVKGFNIEGFNVLVITNDFIKIAPRIQKIILSMPWAIIFDFNAEDSIYRSAQQRMIRRVFAGKDKPPDSMIAQTSTIWLYVNGHIDITALTSKNEGLDWQRSYYKPVTSFIEKMEDQVSGKDVRILAYGLSEYSEELLEVVNIINRTWHRASLQFIFCGNHTLPARCKGDHVFSADIAQLADMYYELHEALPVQRLAFLPVRTGKKVELTALTYEKIEGWERYFTVVHGGLRNVIPKDRLFGKAFLKGATIEWAELDQDFAVKRFLFASIEKKVSEKLKEYSNHTVNLYHEPSAGGTTLSLQIAWYFKEQYPTIVIKHIGSETAEQIASLFEFSNLPVLVILDASTVSESEREKLLSQLRATNTRTVFLWVSRRYAQDASKMTLPALLDKEHEIPIFFDVYSRECETEDRRASLRKLVNYAEYEKQRSLFFFGLTVFERDYVGLDKAIDVLFDRFSPDIDILAYLALCTKFTSCSFPYREACALYASLAQGKSLPDLYDLPIIASDSKQHVKIPHALIADIILERFFGESPSSYLFQALALRFVKDLVQAGIASAIGLDRLLQHLFTNRDVVGALESDVASSFGGLGRMKFSHLIFTISTRDSGLARELFQEIISIWPDEVHYAIHYARHLLYVSPEQIDEAICVMKAALETCFGENDPNAHHMLGMCYRFKMKELFQCALKNATYEELKPSIVDFFSKAVECFSHSASISNDNEFSDVSIIQTCHEFLNISMRCLGVNTLHRLQEDDKNFIFAIECAESAMMRLRRHHRLSRKQELILKDFDLLYSSGFSNYIVKLKRLSSSSIHFARRLCTYVHAKYKRIWSDIPQEELHIMKNRLDSCLHRDNVSEIDFYRWINISRYSVNFDLLQMQNRLRVWMEKIPSAIEPVYYLYVFYFTQMLNTPFESVGPVAAIVKEHLDACKNINMTQGRDQFSREWLCKKSDGKYYIKNWSELSLPLRESILNNKFCDAEMAAEDLCRIAGIMTDYKRQRAWVDVKDRFKARIIPHNLSQDNNGDTVSVYISFSYDEIRGWDPVLENKN